MGSGASRDSSDEEISTQITGDSTVPLSKSSSSGLHHRSSVGRRSTHAAASAAAKKHEIPVHPATNVPVKRAALEPRIDTTNMSDSKSKKNNNLSLESDDDLIPSAKSSSEFDDEAFHKFCGEIDHVLEGHDSVVEATQRRKSSVSSSIVSANGNLLPQLPTASTGREGDFLDGRRGSGPMQTRENFQFEQKQYGYPSAENQLKYQQLGQHPHHQQHQLNNHYLQQHAHQQQQQQQHHDQQHQHTDNMPMVSTPPPLVRKRPEKPISIWKRPDDLAHREQVLRDRYQDTWFQKESASTNYVSGTSLARGASREGSTVRTLRNSDPVAFQEDSREMEREDAVLQEKEGFDVSKFKAANRKTNSHNVDKLLPATYKGYYARLPHKGTLPSLHRGSIISSTLSSSGTPASDKHGSPPFDDVKELKYDSSEEALLDFIEKEFS